MMEVKRKSYLGENLGGRIQNIKWSYDEKCSYSSVYMETNYEGY